MDELLLTRQPIFDSRLHVVAYLLERHFIEGTLKDTPAGNHQSQITALIETEMEHLTAEHRIFISATHNDIEWLMELCAPHPRLGIALEYFPDLDLDASYLARLLAQRGINLALLQFPYTPTLFPFFLQAEIVIIPGGATTPSALGTWLQRLQGYPARGCASGLDTQANFAAAKKAGFELFQGQFLSHPDSWTNRRIPPGLMAPLALLAQLQNPEIAVKDIEDLVKADAALSYRVLRWVNSAYYGIDIEIESISHAIVYLGIDQLRNWLSLMALSGLKPISAELLDMAAIRARMAEIVAPVLDLNPGKAFTLGLFSLLDAILQAPMHEILASLPLSKALKTALEDGTGPYTRLLRLIKNYEQGHWSQVIDTSVPPAQLGEAYLQAIEWTNAHRLSDRPK